MVHIKFLPSQVPTHLVYVTCTCLLTQVMLELTLNQILGDLDLVAGVETGANLVAKIKNTMSDRQKKFNFLLEDYHSEILLTIIFAAFYC